MRRVGRRINGLREDMDPFATSESDLRAPAGLSFDSMPSISEPAHLQSNPDVGSATDVPALQSSPAQRRVRSDNLDRFIFSTALSCLTNIATRGRLKMKENLVECGVVPVLVEFLDNVVSTMDMVQAMQTQSTVIPPTITPNSDGLASQEAVLPLPTPPPDPAIVESSPQTPLEASLVSSVLSRSVDILLAIKLISNLSKYPSIRPHLHADCTRPKRPTLEAMVLAAMAANEAARKLAPTNDGSSGSPDIGSQPKDLSDSNHSLGLVGPGIDGAPPAETTSSPEHLSHMLSRFGLAEVVDDSEEMEDLLNSAGVGAAGPIFMQEPLNSRSAFELVEEFTAPSVYLSEARMWAVVTLRNAYRRDPTTAVLNLPDFGPSSTEDAWVLHKNWCLKFTGETPQANGVSTPAATPAEDGRPIAAAVASAAVAGALAESGVTDVSDSQILLDAAIGDHRSDRADDPMDVDGIEPATASSSLLGLSVGGPLSSGGAGGAGRFHPPGAEQVSPPHHHRGSTGYRTVSAPVGERDDARRVGPSSSHSVATGATLSSAAAAVGAAATVAHHDAPAFASFQ
ncbi:hypothetical protein HK405_008610 [Cladochytrium tenue]|nr:hypothetical protein HK405_008610 [Cladochytrium tenue]